MIADLIVFVPYFAYAFGHHSSLGQIVGTIVVLVVAQIILQSAIALASRNRLTDERDRIIALRGYRAGYLTLVSIFLLGMGGLWLHASLGLLDPKRMALHFLSVFFGFIVIADVVKVITQLVAYRRSL